MSSLNKIIVKKANLTVDEDIFYGAGFGGNYLVIVPEYNLVIVVRWIDSSKIGDFVKKIVDSEIDSTPWVLIMVIYNKTTE